MKNQSIDFRVAFATLALLLALTEALLGVWSPRYWQQGRHAALVSESLLQDRLRALAPQPQRHAERSLLVLGDSVLWGSALREHGVPAWRDKTPGAFVEAGLPEGWRLLEFSADGLMPADMEALLERGLALKPQAVVLQWNYRMLAAAAPARPGLAPGSPFSRPWLDAQEPSPAWDEHAGDFLRRHWSALRYSELAAFLLFQPTLKGALERGLDALFPKASDPDAEEAMLDMKIRPYYEASALAPDAPALEALRRMSARLRQAGIPSLVFLSPQNEVRISGVLNRPAYAANRRLLAAAAKGLPYRDWSSRKIEGSFLDHCHLDEAGNRGLAQWILGELKL